MLINQNIIELLSGDSENQITLKLLDEINSRRGKPFVIFFQPGAGAPVGNNLKEWRSEGLGGCLDELCQIVNLRYQLRSPIIINTMNLDEQFKVNASIISHANVDVSKITVINDPKGTLAEKLGADIVNIQERKAYKPAAWLFNGDGNLVHILTPASVEPGFDRETAKEIETIPAMMNRIWLAASLPASTRHFN